MILQEIHASEQGIQKKTVWGPFQIYVSYTYDLRW